MSKRMRNRALASRAKWADAPAEPESDEALHVRLAKKNRAYGVDGAPRGPGLSVQRVHAWLDEIAKALAAEPDLAQKRLALVRRHLAPLVNAVLEVIDPDADDDAQVAALYRILSVLMDKIKLGRKAMRVFRQDVAAKAGLTVQDIGPVRLERALQELLRADVILAAQDVLGIPVTDIQRIKKTLAQAINGMARVYLLGPDHRAKVGDDEAHPGFSVERHGAAPWTPEMLADADDSEHGARLRAERIEDAALAKIEVHRLLPVIRARAKQYLSERLDFVGRAVGTPAELEVAKAYVRFNGNIKAAAASLAPKKEPTFRSLLGKVRAKNRTGVIQRLLAPRRNHGGRRRCPPHGGPVHPYPKDPNDP